MSGDPHALLKQAEKALSSASGGWSLFGNRQEKYEDAAELFKAAGEVFLGRNMQVEAGKAFERAGEIHMKFKDATGYETSDTYNSYIRAAQAYYKVNTHPNRSDSGANRGDLDSSIRCRKTAVDMYKQLQSNTQKAADQEREIGDLYAGPKNEPNNAIEHYKVSSYLYLETNPPMPALSTKSTRLAADSALKLAFTYATVKGNDERKIANVQINKNFLKEAIDLYQDAAKVSLSKDSMRFSVNGYLFLAGLCRIAYSQILTNTGEKEENQKAFEDPNIGTHFLESTEYGALQTLAEAFETGDREGFAKLGNKHTANDDSRKHLVFVLIGMIGESGPIAHDDADHDAVDGPDFS